MRLKWKLINNPLTEKFKGLYLERVTSEYNHFESYFEAIIDKTDCRWVINFTYNSELVYCESSEGGYVTDTWSELQHEVALDSIKVTLEYDEATLEHYTLTDKEKVTLGALIEEELDYLQWND